MTDVPAKLAACAAALALLGACGGGDDAPSEPVPATAKERLEANYVLSTDVSRIGDRLTRASLERIGAWNDGAVPVPYTGDVELNLDTTWTWQLQGDRIDTRYDVNVYVLDMFAQTDGRVQAELHGSGRYAFCYFSAGTYEPWRPDRDLFDDDMLGEPHIAYGDERWLDITDERTVRIMLNRMDMAEDIGCDGVEFDNIDGYLDGNVTGWDNTAADTAAFARILANAAHERGLAVALKNGPEILPEVIDWFDLSINESCHHFSECEVYRTMTDAGKPVFNAEYGVWRTEAEQHAPGTPEYESGLDRICARSAELRLDTLLLPKSLDGSSRYSCADRAI